MKIYYTVKGVVRQEQYLREKLSSSSRHKNGREYKNNRLKYKCSSLKENMNIMKT